MGNGVYSIEYLHDGGPFVSSITMKAQYHCRENYSVEIKTNDITDFYRIQDFINGIYDYDSSPFVETVSMKSNYLGNGYYNLNVKARNINDWDHIQSWIKNTFDRNKIKEGNHAVQK